MMTPMRAVTPRRPYLQEIADRTDPDSQVTVRGSKLSVAGSPAASSSWLLSSVISGGQTQALPAVTPRRVRFLDADLAVTPAPKSQASVVLSSAASSSSSSTLSFGEKLKAWVDAGNDFTTFEADAVDDESEDDEATDDLPDTLNSHFQADTGGFIGYKGEHDETHAAFITTDGMVLLKRCGEWNGSECVQKPIDLSRVVGDMPERLKKEIPEGRECLLYPDSSIHEREGSKVRITYKNGSVYNGEINADGQKHGLGILIGPDGQLKYVGRWLVDKKESKRIGHGPAWVSRNRLLDGGQLPAQFASLIDGRVVPTQQVFTPMRGLYIGAVNEEGVPHGACGIEYDATGQELRGGVWQNGTLDGRGWIKSRETQTLEEYKLIKGLPIGSTYEGQFKSDKRDGYGKVTDQSGTVIERGLYANDKLVKLQKKSSADVSKQPSAAPIAETVDDPAGVENAAPQVSIMSATPRKKSSRFELHTQHTQSSAAKFTPALKSVLEGELPSARKAAKRKRQEDEQQEEQATPAEKKMALREAGWQGPLDTPRPGRVPLLARKDANC